VKYVVEATESELAAVRRVEEKLKTVKQNGMETWHVLHGGIYSRTIFLEKDQVIVGAQIKVPTTIMINGCLLISSGGESFEIKGVNVIPASKNRKQIMKATEKTSVTMCFATSAKTVEEAEEEFSDEAGNLMSRFSDSINHINITGE
jgi:hypothetical protein